MKKLVLVLGMALVFNLSNAQWKTSEYVDDFGEKTEETYKYQMVDGLFSNSATTNSLCTYVLREDNSTFTISIYPYGRNTKERWIEGSYQVMKIKTPSGEIKEINTFCSKSGILLYNKDNYKKMLEILSEKGKFMFIMYYKNKYSNSTYKFSFTN